MNQESITIDPANGASTTSELFALTDEQILDIRPDSQDVEISAAAPPSDSGSQEADTTVAPEAASGAAPTSPFAAPEEARALAELYPGGLSQAKTAAERARTLDEIDAAYFGAADSSSEQVSASRAQLAQRMMRENPAAFREMVFAGLRALEEGNVGPTFRLASAAAGAQPPQTVAHAFRREDVSRTNDHRAEDGKTLTPEGVSYTANQPDANAHAAYAAFERAANDELERSVGGAITRTIEQALPNLGKNDGSATAGARSIVPLQERLGAAVRQDVEAALKGDRQLGEQIAQILAAKRFDDATRAQIVRLIGERAQQLVPGAARRVIGEWTSATLAAHGARSDRSAAVSSRREVAPASALVSGRNAASSRDASGFDDRRGASAAQRSIDYRKLSDEQILDF